MVYTGTYEASGNRAMDNYRTAQQQATQHAKKLSEDSRDTISDTQWDERMRQDERWGTDSHSPVGQVVKFLF